MELETNSRTAKVAKSHPIRNIRWVLEKNEQLDDVSIVEFRISSTVLLQYRMVRRALKLTVGAVSTTIATRGKGSRSSTLDQTSGCGTPNTSFPCLLISNSRAKGSAPVRAPHLGRAVSEVNDPVFLGCPAGVVGGLRLGRSRMKLERLSKCQTSCLGGTVLSLVRQTAKMGEAGVALAKNKIMGPKKDATFVTVQHSITAYVRAHSKKCDSDRTQKAANG
jgi:hypothetical protein